MLTALDLPLHFLGQHAAPVQLDGCGGTSCAFDTGHNAHEHLISFVALFRLLPQYARFVLDGKLNAAPQLILHRALRDEDLADFQLQASRTKVLLYDGPQPDTMDVPLDSLHNFMRWYWTPGWRPLFPGLVHLKCATDDPHLMSLVVHMPGDNLEILQLYARRGVFPTGPVLRLLARCHRLKSFKIVGQTAARPSVPSGRVQAEGMHRTILAAAPSEVITFLPNLPSLRYLALWGHTLNAREWAVLSALSLEVLQTVVAVPKSSLFMSMVYPNGFHSLRVLRLHAHDLDSNSCYALRSIESPVLSELHLSFTKCPGAGEVFSHLEGLSHCPFAETLQRLQVRLSTLYCPTMCTAKCESVDTRHGLSLLLRFPSLKYLKFECNHLRLTDGFFLDLAMALPDIEVLFLRQRCSTKDGTCPRITDAGALLPFACYCPQLTTLGLDLDVKIDDVPMPPRTIQQCQLQSLEVGCASSTQGEGSNGNIVIADEVMRYVKALFPNLASVGPSRFAEESI